MSDLYHVLATAHPSLKRGRVWCYRCGYTEQVDTASAFRHGWPKHCGETMSIDSPEERQRLRAAYQEEQRE